jgi:hypothetical protein
MKKTNPPDPEENPNVENSHELHRKNKKLGGIPGGNEEGSPSGSRGDSRHHPKTSDAGSRTSKKN